MRRDGDGGVGHNVGQRPTILPESAGFAPDDITFDANGGVYFTDARGSIGQTGGGVWYVGPDGALPGPVPRNPAVANGIALARTESD